MTFEVRDGILEHKSSGNPKTLEGQAVSLADRIAYINHDIEDAIRAGILKESDLPKRAVKVLGDKTKTRINKAIADIYETSYGKNFVRMSEEVMEATNEMRAFMFERVYRNPVAKGEETKAKAMLCRLYEYYYENPQAIPGDFQPQMNMEGMERTICDYIAGMTDKYAVDKYTELFIPMGWNVRG